jgi:mRNA interferase HigB
MRIISKGTLKACWVKHSDSKEQLLDWHNIAEKANWKSPNEVKGSFPNVSILANNRIVFNIKGNDYRLVVYVAYTMSVIYICWVGSHSEYDKIDANTIWDN